MTQQFTPSTDGQNVSIAAGADPTYTARVRGVNWRPDVMLALSSAAELRTTQFADADTYYVRGVGEVLWDEDDTTADNGTTVFQITGVPTGRYKLTGGSSLLATVNGVTAAVSGVVAHGAAAVVDGELDLTPTLGTPYDAEIAGGGSETALVTYALPEASRVTVGIEWSAYNSLDTLEGYQTVVAQRVGSAAPSILSSPFDSSTHQSAGAIAWSPRARLSSNNLQAAITPDALNAMRAKVRMELLKSVSITDSPSATIGEIIALLGGLSGLWWRASDAVDAGGGVAGSIPESVVGTNTLTFSVAGTHTRPTIGTLSAGSDVALICNGTQQASPGSTLGAQTSHTVLCVREHAAGGIQSVSWGSGNSATPGIIPGWNGNTPGVFVTSGWIATGTASGVGDFECLECWLDDGANEARVFRNGTQTGTTGTYSSSTAIAFSGFGCTDTTSVGGLYGRVTDLIYVPSAMGSSDRAALYALISALHTSLP